MSMAEAEHRTHTSSFRRSGRTERALQAAVKLANTGHYVVFVTGTTLEAERVQRLCADQTGGRKAGTKVYIGAGEISFESQDQEQWDWRTMSMRAAHPSCKVVIDHYAVETAYGKILDAWLKYT